MVQLLLSTGNIAADGDALFGKPNSSDELIAALRHNFEFARSLPQENRRPREVLELNTGYQHWTEWDEDTLYIPRRKLEHPSTRPPTRKATSLQERRDNHEVTVKLFFLPRGNIHKRKGFLREATRLVLDDLGITNIDNLIVSFPDIALEGSCSEKANLINGELGNSSEEAKLWSEVEALYEESIAKKIGVAEFGSFKLEDLLQNAKIKPHIDQIGVGSCCRVPTLLEALAKQENIELWTHRDSPNILPTGALRALLGPEPRGFGILGEDAHDTEYELTGDLAPEWAVNYTVLAKDRGVITDKGYFASAELVAR